MDNAGAYLNQQSHFALMRHGKLEEGLEVQRKALAIIGGGLLNDFPRLAEYRERIMAIGEELRALVESCASVPLNAG